MSNDREPTGEELRSFTSWKLDMIDAATFDDRLKPIDRLVLIRVIQHVNILSRLAWPSHQRIAAQIGTHPDTASKITSRIELAGWLKKRTFWNPKSRSKQCEFQVEPSDSLINAILDKVQIRLEEAKEKTVGKARREAQRRLKPADHADQVVNIPTDHVDRLSADHADQMVSDHADHLVRITPKSEPPNRNTLISQGSEGSESSVYEDSDYRRASNGE